jgi:hypothetical protein
MGAAATTATACRDVANIRFWKIEGKTFRSSHMFWKEEGKTSNNYNGSMKICLLLYLLLKCNMESDLQEYDICLLFYLSFIL